MGLFEKLKGLAAKGFNSLGSNVSEADSGLDDWETRDKSLRALRRLKRRQLDIEEREALQRSITNFNRERLRKSLTDNSLLKGDGVGKGYFKGVKKRKSDGFFGRGGLL